jgi:hypothetical protein
VAKERRSVSASEADWTIALLDLWWQRQRDQWALWARGEERDLSRVDAQLYRLCSEHAEQTEATPGRTGEILRRRAARMLVDSHPEVASCRNWIDRAFFTKEAADDRRPSAPVLRARVLELMRLRDAVATLDHLGHEVSPESSPDWGRWLVASYYQNGAATSLRQKAEHLGARSPFLRASCPADRRR